MKGKLRPVTSAVVNNVICTENGGLSQSSVYCRREPNLGCREFKDLGDVTLCQKSLHESCRMDRPNVVMELIWSLGHCECGGHTVHKHSQRRLTADWLAPRESDYSQMRNKISSDWLPSYIKATRQVLEIFKMASYFPESHRIRNPQAVSPCSFLPWSWCQKFPWKHQQQSTATRYKPQRGPWFFKTWLPTLQLNSYPFIFMFSRCTFYTRLLVICFRNYLCFRVDRIESFSWVPISWVINVKSVLYSHYVSLEPIMDALSEVLK